MNVSVLPQSIVTKIKIFNALCDLLEDGDLDKLTTKQLYEAAGVSKTTFYSHFHDKYEVLQWYTDLAHEVGIAQIGRTLTWEEGHRVTTSALLKRRKMLRRASRSMDYNAIKPHSMRWRVESLKATVEECQKKPLTDLLEMQISALAAGELAIADWYTARDDAISVDLLVQAFISIVPDELYEALKNPTIDAENDFELQQKRLELIILETKID